MNHCEAFTPTNPSSQEKAWMDAVEDRLEQMETQQRLFNSSIKGGAMVVYDDDLNQIGRLGVGGYVLADGSLREAPVFAVSDSDSSFHLLLDNAEGWVKPQLTFNWVEDSYLELESATYLETYKTGIVILAKVVLVECVIIIDPGTTGSFKLRMAGQETDVQTFTEGQYLLSWAWNVSSFMGFGTRGLIQLLAKRDSGDGFVVVFAPDNTYCKMVADSPEATTGGIPIT